MRRTVAIVAIVLAVAAAAGLGVGLSLLGRIEGVAAEPEQPQQGGPPVPVVLTAARGMTFEDRVVVSGSVEAKRFALVSARIPGVLDAVYVDEGDYVEAGKTRLFQTDSLKLSKAVAVARQALKVAECSVAEAKARLAQAVADKEQAARDLKRYEELARDNAVSVQVLEKQRTGYEQAEAAVKSLEALVALQQAQLEQARLSLAIAEKDLADSLVLAPLSGRVSQRLKEPGEMAGAGTPVVRIDDLSVVDISVFVPQEYYDRVVPGRTMMRIRVNHTDLGSHPVSYKSPTVDMRLRTFEVKATVSSPPPEVVPGCLAEVTIVLDAERGVGVPSEAIQRRGDRDVVFVVQSGRAHAIPVTRGLEMDGWTQVVKGQLTAGTEVISLGQQLVEEGRPVTILKEAR